MKYYRGYTLIEVVVAMTIILIVGLACIQVLQVNSRSAQSMFKRIQANQYLDQIHNHLRLSNTAVLAEEYHEFPQILTDNNYTAKVSIQPPQLDGVRLATISVYWNQKTQEDSISTQVTLLPQ